MSGGVLEEGEEFWIPLGIPAEFPYEFGLPDSPSESVVGSLSETESDEDELTHLLTRSALQDRTHFPSSSLKAESDRVMASSPKSTLSSPRTWPCHAPVTGPVLKDNTGWGVLFSPTDGSVQASRAKTSCEVPPEPVYPRGGGLLYPQHITNQVQLPPQKIPCSGIFPKHEQVNYQAKLKSMWVFEENRQQIRGLFPQSTWPNLHAERNNNFNGRGVKPVFLSRVKRERTGTGVFLPRRYDTNISNHTAAAPAANPRKKPSFSTVLMPAKVIQSLNLNFEDIGVIRPSQSCFYNYNVGFTPNYDAFMARRNAILAQQKRSLRVDGVNHEVHLPQDWTY